MKKKTKIISGIISTIGISALVAGSIAVGLSYKPDEKKSNNLSNLTLNPQKVNLYSISSNAGHSGTENSQTIYYKLNDAPSPIIAAYNGSIPNGYHLKYQWYRSSSDSSKVSLTDLISGATSSELSPSLMGIKLGTSYNYTYYYFVRIQLVSDITNKVVSSIVSDVYKINNSNLLSNLNISGSVLNTVQVSSNNDADDLFANSNNQTVLSATPSVNNIPSTIKVSYQWYYSGTKQNFDADGNPINGKQIPVSEDSTSNIISNSTANTSSLVLNSQELKNTGIYYYYVKMTLTKNNASEEIYSSYYTVNITKNTVIASVSVQSSSSNIIVNQTNFQQYPIQLNPNISWINQNSNTIYKYQWYRSTTKLNTNNIQQFISEYKQFAITSEENSTYDQEIYYLNQWDANVEANATYYYYLLIEGSTYGVNINPILTSIPVTVTFEATPKITVNKPINVINIDSSTSSYSLKPNVSIQSSKLVASSNEIYQWYYSLNDKITDNEWNQGSVSINNNTISLSNISNLKIIDNATSSTYNLTKNNFINSSYYGKKIYFYLIVAYTINDVVVSNLSAINNELPTPYTIEISQPSQSVTSSSPTISFSTSDYNLVQNQTSNLPTFVPTISGTNSNELVTYKWYSSSSKDVICNQQTGEITNANLINGATKESYTVSSQETSNTGTYYYYLLLTITNYSNSNYTTTYILSSPIIVQVSDIPSLTFGTNNQTIFNTTITNNSPISLTSDLNIGVPTGMELSNYSVTFEWFMSTNKNWTYSTNVSSYLAKNSSSNTYSLNSNNTGYNDAYTIDSSYFQNPGTKYFYVVAFLSLNGKIINYSQSSLTYKLIVQSPDTSTFNVSESTPLTKIAFVNQNESVDFGVSASYSANSSNFSFKYQWVLINGATGQEVLSSNSSYKVNNGVLTILSSLFTYSSNLIYQCNVLLYINNQYVSSKSINFTLNIYANPSININSAGSLEPISKDSSIVFSNTLNKTVIYNQENNQTLSINSSLTATNDNNSSISISSSSIETSYSWYISNSTGEQITQITSSNKNYSLTQNNSLVINASNFTGNTFTNETGTLYYLLVIQIDNVQINSKPITKEVLVSVNVIAPPNFSFINSTTNITATVNEKNYQTLTATANYTIADTTFANAQISYAWYKVTQDSTNESISNTNSYTLKSSDVLSSPGTVQFYVIASVTINGTIYSSNKLNYIVNFINAPTITLTPSTSTSTVYKNQNSTITLSANVTSSDQQANLNYQWYICDENGSNAIAINSTNTGYSGYNTNTLNISSSVYNSLTNTHVLYYYLQVTSNINGLTIYQNNNTKSIISLVVNGPLQYNTNANKTNSTISTYVNSNSVALTANPSVVYETYASNSNNLNIYSDVTFSYAWYQKGNPSKVLSTSQVFDVPSDLLSVNTSFYYVATANIGINLVSSLGTYTSGNYDVNITALPSLTINASGYNQISTIVDNEPSTGFLANISINNLNSQLGGISNLTYTWYKLNSNQAPSVVNSIWVKNNVSNIVSNGNEQYFNDFSSYISSSNNYYFYCVATAEVNGTIIYSTSSTIFSLLVANKPVITVNSVGKTTLNIYQDQSNAQSFQINASVSFTTGSGSVLNTSTYALNYQWFEVPANFVANINNLTSLMNNEYSGASELNGQNSNTYSLPILTLQKNSVGSMFYYFCVAYIKVGSNYYFAQNGSMGKVNQITIYSNPSLNLSSPSQKINTYVNANNSVLQVSANVSAIGANNTSQNLSVSSYVYNWYEVDSSNYTILPSNSLQTQSTSNSLDTFTIPSSLLNTAPSILYFVCQVEVPQLDDISLNTKTGGLVSTILFTVNVSSTPQITITSNLSNQIGFNGQTSPITFNVNANLNTNLSDITLSYKWYSSTSPISAKTPTSSDGTLISNNDLPLYRITNISNTSNKPIVTYYFVIISAILPGYSSPISVVSNVASLTIYPTPKPSFTSQTSTYNIYEGQTSNLPNLNSGLTWNGDYNAEITLSASYQWYRGSTSNITKVSSLSSSEKINGANSLSYQLTSSDSTLSNGNWYYYLVVTYNLPGNSSISEVFEIATVNILSVPTINVTPLNQTVDATIGETNYQTLVASVSLNPTSSLLANLTYKWYSSSTSGLTLKELEDSATLLNNANNSSSYTLNSNDLLSTTGSKYFYLVVSGNINGISLTSKFTTFTVNFFNSPTISVTINPTGPITYYLSQSKNQNLFGTYSISTDVNLNNITYSWYYSSSNNNVKNAIQIINQTKSSLTLTNSLVQEIYKKIGNSFYIYLEVSGIINQNTIIGSSTIQINVESAPTFSYPSGTTNIPSSPFKIYNPSSSSSSSTTSSQPVVVGPSVQPTSSSSLSYSYQWYYSTLFNSSNPSSLSSSYEILNATSNQYDFLPTNIVNSSGQTFNDIVGKNGGTIYLYLMVTGTNSNGASTSNYYGPYTFSIQTIPSITVALPTSPITVYWGTTSGFSTIVPTLTPIDSSNNPITNSDFSVSYLWQWKIKGSSSWNNNQFSGDSDNILTIGTVFTSPSSFKNQTIYIQLTVTITSNLDKASQTFVSSDNATINLLTLPLLTITPTSSLDINGYVGQTTNLPTINYKLNNAISGMVFKYQLWSTTNRSWALSTGGIWGFTSWTNVETITSTSSDFSYQLTSSDFSSAQNVYYTLAVTITYNGASTIQYWTGWTGNNSNVTSAASGVYTLTVNNLTKPTINLPSTTRFTWYNGQTSSIVLKPEEIISSISGGVLSYQWIIQSYGNGKTTTLVDTIIPSSDNGNDLSLPITSAYMNPNSGFFNLSNVPLTIRDTYNVVLKVTLTLNGASVSTTSSSAFSITYANLTNATINMPTNNSFSIYENQTNPVYFSPTVTNNMSSEGASLTYQWKLVSYLPYGGKITNFNNSGINISSTYGGNSALLSMSYSNLNAILTANNFSLNVGATYYFVLEVTTSLNGASVSNTSKQFSLQYTTIIPNLTLNTTVSTIYNGQTENLPVLSVTLNNASYFNNYTITYNWYIAYSDSSGAVLNSIGSGSSINTSSSTFSYGYSSGASAYFVVFITLTSKDNNYSETFSSAQTSTKGGISGALTSNLGTYSNGFLLITLKPAPMLVVNSKTTSTSIIKNQTIPVTFTPESYDIVNSNNQSIISGNNVTYSYQWYVMPTNDTNPQGLAQADSYGYILSNGNGISGATSSTLELTNISKYFQNVGNYFFYLKVSANWNGINLSSKYTYYYELSVSAIPTLNIGLNYQNIKVYNGQSTNLPVLSLGSSNNGNSSEFDSYNIKYNWYIAYASANSASLPSGQAVTLLGSGTSLQITYAILKFLYSNFNKSTGASPMGFIFVQAIITSATGATETIYSSSSITGIINNKTTGSSLSDGSSTGGYVNISTITAPSISIDSNNNAAITAYKNQTSSVVFQPTSMTVNNNTLNSTYAITYQWYVMPFGSKPQGSAQSDSGGSTISGATAWNLELTNNFFKTTGNFYYYLAITIIVDGISSTIYSNYYELSVVNIPTLTFSSSSSTTNTTFSSYNIYTLQTQNLPLLNVYTNFSDPKFSGMSITYQWYVTYSANSGSNVAIESNSDTSSLQLQPLNFSFFVTNSSVGTFYVFLSATITTSTGASETFYSTPNTTVTTNGSKITSSGDNLSKNIGYFQINASAMPSFTLSSSSQTINTVTGYNEKISFSPTSISSSSSLLSGTVVQYEYQWYNINNPTSVPSGTASSNTKSSYNVTTAKGISTNYNYNVDSSYLSTVQTNYFYLVVTVIVNGYTLPDQLYSNFYCISTQTISSFLPNHSSMPWANVNYYSNQTNSSVLSPQFTTPGYNLYGVSYTYDWYINNNQENLDGNVEQIKNNTPTLNLAELFADPSAYGVSSAIKGTGTYYIYLTVVQNIGGTSKNYNIQGYAITYNSTQSISIGFNNKTSSYSTYVNSSAPIYIYPDPYAFSGGNNNLGGYFTYQWYQNSKDSTSGGTIISNSTNSYYEPIISTIGTYYYYVEVTFTSSLTGITVNSTSPIYTVIVNAIPTLTINTLPSQSSWTNNNTPSVIYNATTQNFPTLSPVITLNPASNEGVSLTYQWYLNGQAISSETFQALTLDPQKFSSLSGIQKFYLSVTMSIPGFASKTYESATYYVDFKSAPTFSLTTPKQFYYILPDQYTNESFSVNTNTTIASDIGNNANLTFEWYSGTSVNNINTIISGETSSYLSLNNIFSSTPTPGNYYYKVVVSAKYNGYNIPSQSITFYLVVLGLNDVGAIVTGNDSSGTTTTVFGNQTTISATYPYISLPTNISGTSTAYKEAWSQTINFDGSSPYSDQNYWIISQNKNLLAFNNALTSSSVSTSLYNNAAQLTYQWEEAEINNYGLYEWQNLPGGNSSEAEINFNVYSNPINYFRLKISLTNYPDVYIYSPLYVIYYKYSTSTQTTDFGVKYTAQKLNYDNWINNLDNQKFVLISYLTHNNIATSNSYFSNGNYGSDNGTLLKFLFTKPNITDYSSVTWNVIPQYFNGLDYTDFGSPNKKTYTMTPFQTLFNSTTNNGISYNSPDITITNLQYYKANSVMVPGMTSYYYWWYNSGLVIGAWMITGILDKPLSYAWFNPALNVNGGYGNSEIPAGTELHLLLPFSLTQSNGYSTQYNNGGYNNDVSQTTISTTIGTSSGTSLSWTNSSFVNDALWFYFGSSPNIQNNKVTATNDPMMNQVMYYGQIDASAFSINSSDSYIPSYTWDY